MGRGAWKATVQGVLKNQTHTHTQKESDTSEPLSLPLHGMIFKSKLTVIIKFSLNIKKKKILVAAPTSPVMMGSFFICKIRMMLPTLTVRVCMQ